MPPNCKRDLALVCDTGMWDAQTPSITTSLRGLVYEEVRLTCADRDLHSGLFGGAARNPIHVLADILSALHKPDGSVAIPGFYDGVHELPPDIKADLAGLGLTPEKFLGPIGLKIPAGEKGRMLIEQISTRPTAEVNGIIGGYTGEGAKTVIPGKAMAKVSFRLVGAQDPEKIRAAFRDFVRARLPADCKVEFGNFGSAPAFDVAFDNPALAKARAALAEEWGKKAVTVGAGGSIPIVGDFKTVLGMDTLMVGFALDDDRVHSPNEKFDLKCFHKGIRSWARILAALADGLECEFYLSCPPKAKVSNGNNYARGRLIGRRGGDQARTDEALQPARIAHAAATSHRRARSMTTSRDVGSFSADAFARFHVARGDQSDREIVQARIVADDEERVRIARLADHADELLRTGVVDAFVVHDPRRLGKGRGEERPGFLARVAGDTRTRSGTRPWRAI